MTKVFIHPFHDSVSWRVFSCNDQSKRSSSPLSRTPKNERRLVLKPPSRGPGWAGYGSNCAFWGPHYYWRILNEPMLSRLELGFYPQNQNTKTDQLITTVTQAAPSPAQFAVLLAPQRLLRSACLRAGWPGFSQIAGVDKCSSLIICCS